MNKDLITLKEASTQLIEQLGGGKTEVNYMPVRDSILLKVTIKLKAVQMVLCETPKQLIDTATRIFVVNKEPNMILETAAIGKELSEAQNIPLNAKVDIKSPDLLTYRPFIKGSIDIFKYLENFKESNLLLFKGAVIAKDEDSIHKKVLNMDLRDFENANDAEDMITISFHVATSFHNIDGVYISPDDIEHEELPVLIEKAKPIIALQ